MAVILKKHSSPEGQFVSLCDKDILGKRFEEKGIVLDINKDFYGGDETAKNDVCKALSECESAIITGNESVALAIECGAVKARGAKEVEGIKCAMMFRV